MRKTLALWPGALLAAPLLAFALVPLAVLLLRALDGDGGALGVLAEPQTRVALWHSVAASGGAAAVALLLGAPLSFLLFRTDLPLRRALLALFTAPSALPPFVLGMGWVALASPRTGLLNRALSTSFDIYSLGGMVLVLGTAGLPLVLLAGGAALARLDPALEEAARVSGAGPLRAVLGTTLPLAAPALLSGACLAFLLALSAFGVPYLLGVASTPPTVLLTTQIYGQLLLGSRSGLSGAMALSLLLLVLAGAALALNALLVRRGRVRVSAGKGQAARNQPLGRAKGPLLAATLALAVMLIVLPLIAVLLTSLQRVPGAALALGELTVAHWRSVLGSGRTLEAAGWSVALSLAAGAIVTAYGLAVALWRRRSARLGRALDTLASWPYAVPGTVLAMALIAAFSRDVRFILANRIAFVLALANTFWLLLCAYAAKHLAFGVRQVADAVTQLDPSLEEAARISGASAGRALWDVALPLLRPALASAFLLSFLACATELTLSVLLIPPGSQTLGTLLFELQSYSDPASAAVLACGFVLLVATAGGAAFALRGRASA